MGFLHLLLGKSHFRPCLCRNTENSKRVHKYSSSTLWIVNRIASIMKHRLECACLQSNTVFYSSSPLFYPGFGVKFSLRDSIFFNKCAINRFGILQRSWQKSSILRSNDEALTPPQSCPLKLRYSSLLLCLSFSSKVLHWQKPHSMRSLSYFLPLV